MACPAPKNVLVIASLCEIASFSLLIVANDEVNGIIHSQPYSYGGKQCCWFGDPQPIIIRAAGVKTPGYGIGNTGNKGQPHIPQQQNPGHHNHPKQAAGCTINHEQAC